MASLMTGPGRLMRKDHSDKKVNKHICQGYSVPLLQIILYQMSLSADNFLFQIITKGCKNDRMGLVPSPASCIYTCRKILWKKWQKQVKKKAFKINAKNWGCRIEWRLKKYGNKKWSLNFHDQPKSQNPIYCFFFSFFKSEFSVSFWSKKAPTTIKENN